MLQFTVLALALAAAPVATDTKVDPEARARAIAPFLDEEVVAVAHLDLKRLDSTALAARFAELGRLSAEDTRRAKSLLEHLTRSVTRAGGREAYFVVSLADLSPTHPMPGFVIIPLQEGADAKVLAQLAGRGFEVGAQLPRTRAVFGGSKDALARLRTLKPTPHPELARAFAAAGNTAAQLLLLPTADNRRVIEEIIPTLPRQIGGSSKVITEGMRWAALGLDLTPRLALRLVIQSKNADAARALHNLAARAVKLLDRQKDFHELFPNSEQLVAQLVPKVKEDRLTLAFNDQQLTTVLKPLLAQMRRSAARDLSANHLKQIGIALHNYYDQHKVFPTAARYDPQGKPLLSWRVQLLPFLAEEKLYKEFHLDEPWDSTHNKKLIARLPAVYRPRNRKLAEAGKTTYLAPLGEATMFPGRKPLRIQDVIDGTSNTIFIVEAAEEQAVIWTKPEDLKYDPRKPLAGLIGKRQQGFLALFVDASVRFIAAKTDPRTVGAYFTRNGGEVLPQDAP